MRLKRAGHERRNAFCAKGQHGHGFASHSGFLSAERFQFCTEAGQFRFGGFGALLLGFPSLFPAKGVMVAMVLPPSVARDIVKYTRNRNCRQPENSKP
jgi:hypothetical protein